VLQYVRIIFTTNVNNIIYSDRYSWGSFSSVINGIKVYKHNILYIHLLRTYVPIIITIFRLKLENRNVCLYSPADFDLDEPVESHNNFRVKPPRYVDIIM